MNYATKHANTKCSTDSKNIFSQDFQKEPETFTQVSDHFGISEMN